MMQMGAGPGHCQLPEDKSNGPMGDEWAWPGRLCSGQEAPKPPTRAPREWG